MQKGQELGGIWVEELDSDKELGAGEDRLDEDSLGGDWDWMDKD